MRMFCLYASAMHSRVWQMNLPPIKRKDGVLGPGSGRLSAILSADEGQQGEDQRGTDGATAASKLPLVK